MTPYAPGEQPLQTGLIKINTNESPFSPTPAVQRAIRDAVNSDLRLYPDPNAFLLRQAISQAHGVNIDEVFVGNGSDEVLGHAISALMDHGAPVLLPDITYGFYQIWCALYGIDFKLIPLNADFDIETDDYRQAAGGIIIANPNAPTGRFLSVQQITGLLELHPGRVLIVDEAYGDFCDQSAVQLIQHFPNLLVTRTFSKSRALAGMRIGYALGQKPLIEGLERVKGCFTPYPVDRLAQIAGAAAIADPNYREQIDAIVSERIRLSDTLLALGFDVVPSSANFILTRHPKLPGIDLYNALRRRDILVRHFSTPRLQTYIRITVGTTAQMGQLAKTLTDLLF
ncbi:histidinol-phosphate transaminase [Asticcacaulis benevestitus]|uniref:histidinol-phosphate transaminase n=1 Tax=Asticcacaulis benevestitus TaxID=347481 RepID=UPI00191C14B4|nr:histidinol-phosphate transaminase [Asticcacaulis benevestitus]